MSIAMSTIERLVPHPKCRLYSLELSKSTQTRAFLFFHQMKAKKCVVSAQLYRQSAYIVGQREMLFWGLSMGGFSWFKRIISSFYSENLLLYDWVAFLIFGSGIIHVNIELLVHLELVLILFENHELHLMLFEVARFIFKNFPNLRK